MGKGKRRGRSQTKAERLVSGHIAHQTKNTPIPAMPPAHPPAMGSQGISRSAQIGQIHQQSHPLAVEKTAPRPHSFWVAIGSSGLLVLSVASNIVTVWGPFWPTEPVFSPMYVSANSPFDIPIKVENRSKLFPIIGISMTCKAANILTLRKNRINSTFSYDVVREHEIPCDTVKTFICPFSNLVSLGDDKITNG